MLSYLLTTGSNCQSAFETVAACRWRIWPSALLVKSLLLMQKRHGMSWFLLLYVNVGPNLERCCDCKVVAKCEITDQQKRSQVAAGLVWLSRTTAWIISAGGWEPMLPGPPRGTMDNK